MMYKTKAAASTTVHHRRVGRRVRRWVRAFRPYQWLQYFALLMLAVGASMLAYGAFKL